MPPFRREASIAERAREPRKKTHAENTVVHGKLVERALEEWDQMVVVTRDLPDDPSSVPERSMAELLCQPELLGELGRLVEMAFRGRCVADSRASTSPSVRKTSQRFASLMGSVPARL